ncbi:GDP-mannose 4,6-dehydratase [Acidobacteria bacterium AH-259-D05]|nr:GDP-mannose 4,6-dehydratase [Acidobacteria bacterium AH-259-D05]
MSLRGKRVLVTGGSGFIGSHLCHRLLQEGASLFVQVKYNSVIDNVRLTGIWAQLTPVEADLRNPDSLSQLREIRPQVIYHFAAYNDVGDSFLHVDEAIDSNGKGSINLLEAYQDYERFIYISTSEVYGYQERVPFREDATPFPLSPYAVGKYTGELYARLKWRSFNKPVVVLRPFNAFGPYQSPRAVIAEVIIKCLGGEPVLTTEGRQTRDFNFVENLVDGFILAVTRQEALGEIINIGSGMEISICDLVKRIHNLTGSCGDLRIGTLSDRPGEISRMFADNDKAKRLLGWSPRIDLDKGLSHTIEWYRRYISAFECPDSVLSKLTS